MNNRRKIVITAVALLSLAIAAMPAGGKGIAWLSVEFAHAIESVTEIRVFSLDRLDPTCPQCI